MKKTKVKCVFIVMAVFMALSCKNNVNVLQNQKNESSLSTSEAYLTKLIALDSMCSEMVVDDEEYPSILRCFELEDDEGNTFKFADLTDEEKKEFYEGWKEAYVKQLEEKYSKDPDLEKIVNLENQVFFETLNSNKGNRAAIKHSVEDFYKIYEKNLTKRIHQEEKISNRSLKPFTAEEKELYTITSDCLVKESVEKFKASYKKGNFLVCKDSSSAVSSSYLGHASLMHADSWNKKWESDGRIFATITSSPKDRSAQWAGKIHGVQYEPIGYWAGNCEGSANKVSIFKVRESSFVSDLIGSAIKKKIDIKPKDVTEKERAKAVSVAKSQLGKEYTYF